MATIGVKHEEDRATAEIVPAAVVAELRAGIVRLRYDLATCHTGRLTEKTTDLQEAFGLACWANAISRAEMGATFKPTNSKASTQDGLNPSHVGLDEIHAHKSVDLLSVLTSAAGARSNPKL